MAKVPNGVETLRKISAGSLGRTNVIDRRQTDGRATAFTFAKNAFVNHNKTNDYIQFIIIAFGVSSFIERKITRDCCIVYIMGNFKNFNTVDVEMIFVCFSLCHIFNVLKPILTFVKWT